MFYFSYTTGKKKPWNGKDFPSRGFSEKHIYTKGFIQDIQLIDNNFLWSVPLSTIEMTSKCWNRWNHGPQAGGSLQSFFFSYNNVDSFCQDIHYLAISKIAGKADGEKLRENCVWAPGESRRSGDRKLCFQYLVTLYQLPIYPVIVQFRQWET